MTELTNRDNKGSFGEKSGAHYITPDNRARKVFLYTLYSLGLIGIGAAIINFIHPFYIIGLVLAGSALVVMLKYPFSGFLVYLAIYYLRPGERIEGLAALRLELVFGAFLLALLVVADAVRGRGIRFPKDRISIAMLIFIGVMATSMVFSEWVTQSYDAVVHVIKTFILYYFIVVLVTDERRFQTVFWLVVLFTAFIGIESMLNYYSGNYVFDQGIMRAEGQTSYGRNFNGLAMYMATNLPLLFYLMMRHRKIYIWIICLGLAAACTQTLLITGSRSGLLCLATVVISFIWFSRHRLLYYTLMFLMALAIWVVLPDQYKTRYSTMTEGEIDASTMGRINAWKAGLDMFLEKPFFGVGPAVFAAAYFDRRGIWLSSHSLYVEAIATMGIAGLVSWGLFLFMFIYRLRKLRHWRPANFYERIDSDIFTRATYSIIAGLLVAGIFGHILFRDTWYIMAGLAVVRWNVLARKRQIETSQKVEDQVMASNPGS